MTEANEDIAAFDPPTLDVEFDGATITVRTLTVLQAIQVSKHVKTIAPAIARLHSSAGEPALEMVPELLADHGEAILEAVSIATRIPLHQLQNTSDFGGLIALVVACIRLNVDFFAQRVGPVLVDLRAENRLVGGQMESSA